MEFFDADGRRVRVKFGDTPSERLNLNLTNFK